MADEITTIGEMLRYRGENEPNRKAFEFYNKEGSYMLLSAGQIWELAGKFASRLHHYAFKLGDVIANGLPNSPERLITDMGIILAGCVVANCQVVEKDGSNFFNVVRMSQCKGVIVPSRTEDDAYNLVKPYIKGGNVAKGALGCSELAIPQAPTCSRVLIASRGSTASLLDDLGSSDEEPFHLHRKPSDLAVLFATSGSTGFSKLVPVSNERIFQQARAFPAAGDSTSFNDRPMGWIGGFPFDFLAYGTFKYVQDHFDGLHATDAEELWNVIAMTGCQGAALLPGAIYQLIDIHKESPPDFKLGFIATGGQALRQELIQALGLLCQAIVISYGATEGGICAFTVITQPSQFKDFLCGTKFKDVELKVVDDDGNEVETGETGHLLVKSPRNFDNYYNLEAPPVRSTFFTSDGFFRTGDRARIDSDGLLYCYGRAGDVVTRGGSDIYLSWPEAILNKCPLIQNSSVIGVEEQNGKNPFLCACVVPRLGVEVNGQQVIDYFEGALVKGGDKSSCMPKMGHVMILDQLPTLPSGKPNKLHLKKLVLEDLGMTS